MNDFSQQQNNNPTDDNSINNSGVPSFKIDLNGLKERAIPNEPNIVGSTPEGIPIILDKKPEQEVVVDKPLEYSVESTKSIEIGQEELSAEKIETSSENINGGNNNTSTVQTQTDGNLKESSTVNSEVLPKKEVLKYSGYPIDDTLLNDVEKVKHEKGKGDSGDGLTAILLFLDRLFRIRDKAK